MMTVDDALKLAEDVENHGDKRSSSLSGQALAALAGEVRRLRQDVEPTADNANEFLKKLPEGHRLSVFAQFCSGCGGDDPRCQCWNDE